MRIYCRRCAKSQLATNLVEYSSKGGRSRVKGLCSVCKGIVSQFGSIVYEEATKPAPIPLLAPMGQPIQLGSLSEGSKFEVGGKFFIVESKERAGILTSRIIPISGGFSKAEKVMMGVVSLVRAAR